jgi:hypothetical protein
VRIVLLAAAAAANADAAAAAKRFSTLQQHPLFNTR